MKRSGEQGMVLVACLLILVLLSLLGASSLLTSTFDTQMAGNVLRHGEAFYAAEAGLEVGVGRIINEFRTSLSTYVPDATWTTPDTAAGDPCGATFNGYNVSFRISNALNPLSPATEPTATQYSTVKYGQSVLHQAYLYQLEGKAESDHGNSTLAETLRVLETPLVQYFIFFDKDLSFFPGSDMDCWGRVHTNGNLYLAPFNTLQFHNFDVQRNQTPNQLTVAGSIIFGSLLNEGGVNQSQVNNSTTSTSTSVRTKNLTTIPAVGANAPSSDYVNISTSITPANQAAQEALFRDTSNSFHVKIGVEKLPSASIATITPGGFYDLEAAGPRKPDVDGMRIKIIGSQLNVKICLHGGSEVDVSDLVRDCQVTTGVYANLTTWGSDALTLASGAIAPASSASAPKIAGTLVYSPEKPVPHNDVPTNLYSTARGAGTNNPLYPCILERQDPRETREVDFTVVDMQRLQLWYRDYLDYQDNGAVDGSNTASSTSSWNPANRNLLIYATRTGATPTTSSPSAALQAIKLIGSRAGRTRGSAMAANRQSGVTLLTRTTFVTDNALYLDGDFNAPGGSTGTNGPGSFGCALVSDATTLLSNSWGNTPTGMAAGKVTYAQTGGTYTKPEATITAFNAAFFTGRFDYTQTVAPGGFRAGSAVPGAEAGVINFLRFIENWGSVEFHMNGCLINLWFSAQATRDYVCCGNTSTDVYTQPIRVQGWDVGFANRLYWPPYVPSIYTVERVSWQEQ